MPSIACTSADVFRHLTTIFPKFWQRENGRLGPAVMLTSLMRMAVLGTNGYDRTMREMKQHLGHVLGWDEEPSAAAFCQARANLTEKFCTQAIAAVRDLCRTARDHRSVDYDGRHLLVFDGTKLPLPAYAKLRDHFGCPRQCPEGPQASLTVLWDVGANQPVDWRLGQYLESEPAHAAKMVASVAARALVLADCNFTSRALMFALAERSADWLMHVRCTGPATYREVDDFLASGENDRAVVLGYRDGHGREQPQRGRVHVRLLRLVFPNGDVRVFITSLVDSERHPREALLRLYEQRWRVETAFREMKLWNGLQRFHGRTPLAIFQEVAAVMMFQLLASELEAQARVSFATDVAPAAGQEVANVRVAPIRFNRRSIAYAAIDLLCAAGPGRVEEVFQDTLRHLWRYRQKPKPRRSFTRERKSAVTGFRYARKRASGGRGDALA